MKTLDLTDDRLDAAVRRLDPAAPALTAAELRRADDLRARILLSAPDANILGRPPVPGDELPVPKPRRRRLVLIGGAVAALTGVLVAAPLFVDGERGAAAWSATPTNLRVDEARELGEKCLERAEESYTRRDLMGGLPEGVEPPPAGSFEPDQRRAMRVVVGERRGDYEFVVLGNGAGFELGCLSIGSDDAAVGGGTFPLMAPAANGVSVTGSAQGGEDADDPSATVAIGRAGQDVRAVTFDTPNGELSATVSNGWFAAAWPAWVKFPNPPFADITVTLTLADGTRTEPVAYDSLPGRDVPPELREPTPAPS